MQENQFHFQIVFPRTSVSYCQIQLVLRIVFSIRKDFVKELSESISLSDSTTGVFAKYWKKVISIDPTMVSGSSNLSNVPILVTLANDSDLTAPKVGNNGEGIRFTSNGSTEIDFEIESFDGNTGTLTAWVEVSNRKT